MAEMGADAGKSTAIRNIGLLSAGQAIGGSNQSIVMSVAAIAAAGFAPDPKLATVPATAMIIGLALSAGPATFFIYRLGRRGGFILGALLAVLAGLVASWAVHANNFWLFCAALVFGGSSAAFVQQYRFAVADSVPMDIKARAISFVMLGGVVAGFVGPRSAYLARDLVPGTSFSGSFLVMAAFGVVAMALMSQTRLAPVRQPQEGEDGGRPLRELLRTPDVLVPILSGMASYALMTFVMVAAPLAMVSECGLPAEQATTAIQWHIVAMYGPSFVTGMIINRIGAHVTAGLGLALILVSAMVALNGITTWHFYGALVLLGLGWNFGFIGSTALLTASYRPEEARRVQALNEQLVFGTMAVASVSSGVLLQTIGWQSINVLAIPFATAGIAALAWGDYAARGRRMA